MLIDRQLYGTTSQLWHNLDSGRLSSITSDEGFQQSDPASTLLYCTVIHDFFHQLQTFLLNLTHGKASQLFFVDEGTLIGPHLYILATVRFIQTHGLRVGYRLNTSKGKLLLVSCLSMSVLLLASLLNSKFS